MKQESDGFRKEELGSECPAEQLQREKNGTTNPDGKCYCLTWFDPFFLFPLFSKDNLFQFQTIIAGALVAFSE